MAAGRRRGRLGLALLVHAIHLATGLLHLVAAVLAVMLALLVLAVVHPRHLMTCMRIGGRGGLSPSRNGQGKRDCANNNLQFNLHKIEFVQSILRETRRGCWKLGQEAVIELDQRGPFDRRSECMRL